MATYDLAFHTRLDGYAILQTFVETGIQVGDSVVIAGASHGLSATATIVSTQDFEFIGVSDEGDLLFDSDVIRLYQFLYVNAGTDFPRDTATGTVTFTPSISWCTNAMVLEFLGIDVATANDTAFITTCVAAANSATLYRERGSADSFASFDSMSSIPVPSTMGRIMALIGCGRPQVA